MNYLKGETATLPLATHFGNVTRALDDIKHLAGYARNKDHVLERSVQARQSLIEIEKQLKGATQ